jgi:hypothetical protein
MTVSLSRQDKLCQEIVIDYGAALARLARGYEPDPQNHQDSPHQESAAAALPPHERRRFVTARRAAGRGRGALDGASLAASCEGW